MHRIRSKIRNQIPVFLTFVFWITSCWAETYSDDVVFEGGQIEWIRKDEGDLTCLSTVDGKSTVDWAEEDQKRHLEATEITIYWKPSSSHEANQLDKVVAKGGVSFQHGAFSLKGGTCTYTPPLQEKDLRQGKIVCSENVSIVDGPRKAEGDSLVFDLEKKTYRLVSSKKKRVKTIVPSRVPLKKSSL